MIATILTSSSTFHAVEYNQMKVAQGSAELLEMTNFGYLQLADQVSARDLQQYLQAYSSRNTHIRKAQFHVAFSCKGDEYSFEELTQIAHRYLHDMGYDNDGQPLLIYAHHDTDNRHIHVITSRVAPDGHKIDHNHEKKRSLAVINRIMEERTYQDQSQVISDVLAYRFESPAQFRAILESQGYTCYMDSDDLCLKKGGELAGKVKLADIEKHCQQSQTARKNKRLSALLLKFREYAASKEELSDLMHKLFGVQLVFLGKADSPYGYILVDHKNKCTYKGSEILPLKTLLQFKTPEERFRDMDAMIATLLESHPRLTSYELNRIIRRQFGANINKGSITWGGEQHLIPEDLKSDIRANDRLHWLQEFGPSSDLEIQALCRFAKIDDLRLITPRAKNQKNFQKSVATVQDILQHSFPSNVKSKFFEAGIRVYRFADQFICLDLCHHALYTMNEQKIDLELLNQAYLHPVTPSVSQSPVNGIGTALGRTFGKSGGAKDENREHEVGSHGSYENIDDDRKLKR
jgi:hypothetical protein